MKTPLKFRNNIPFYYDKSSEDFRQDPYERYDPMVIRQSMIHLVDHLWKQYPMQEVLDYVMKVISQSNPMDLLEIGCGVGRCIGSISSQYTKSRCWGVDYSYQMLKQAKQVWVDGKDVNVDASRFGFWEDVIVESRSLTNLNLGLSKGEALPFSDKSQDVVFSSFLLDRLTDPIQGMREMKRVVRDTGKIIMVTPFNFAQSDQWEQFYPMSKFQAILKELDLIILDWVEDMNVHEPLDKRGNKIVWNCVAMVLERQ